jgi:ATP-dependent Lhr-like helicase
MTSPRAAAVAATIDPGHDRSIAVLRRWCSGRGWEPFPFQEEVWRACAAGESGLVHAPTGTGKTLAA